MFQYLFYIDNREQKILKSICLDKDINEKNVNDFFINFSTSRRKTYDSDNLQRIVCKLENLSVGDFQVTKRNIMDNTEEICLIIERKTVTDFLASRRDSRLKNQKFRMLQTKSKFRMYIFEKDSTFIDQFELYSYLCRLNFLYDVTTLITNSMDDTKKYLLTLYDRLFMDKKFNYFLKTYNLLSENNPDNTMNETNSTIAEEYCKTSFHTKKKYFNQEVFFINTLTNIPLISVSIAKFLFEMSNGSLLQLQERLKNDKEFIAKEIIPGYKKCIGKKVVENLIKHLLF